MSQPRFVDVPPGHWAEKEILAMVATGLMQGHDGGRFGLGEPMTREQMAVVLYRLVMDTPQRAVVNALHSLVFIQSWWRDSLGNINSSVGAGFWARDWEVVTNDHCIAERSGVIANTIAVHAFPGAGQPLDHAMTATVIRRVSQHDLALLRVTPRVAGTTPFPAIPLAPQAPRQATRVWALGSPFGVFPWDISAGTIRSLDRRIRYWTHDQDVWALDVPINPGNSGGILCDIKGRLVGVPSAGIPGVNDYTFAIPLQHVRQLLAS